MVTGNGNQHVALLQIGLEMATDEKSRGPIDRLVSQSPTAVN